MKTSNANQIREHVSILPGRMPLQVKTREMPECFVGARALYGYPDGFLYRIKSPTRGVVWGKSPVNLYIRWAPSVVL